MNDLGDAILYIVGSLIGLGLGAVYLHFYYRNR